MKQPPQHPIIIITAPSGAGKTTITRHLMQQYPLLAFSVSAATRAPRPNEQHGVDYYFMSEEEFREKINADAFLEWEMVYPGKYYGTLKSELQRIWQNKQVPLLDIDVKGAMRVQQLYPGQTLSLFIAPPSLEVLEQRLRHRGTETPESLQARLEKAAFEMSFQNQFDRVIVNDQLPLACAAATAAVQQFLGTPPVGTPAEKQ